MCIRQPDPAEAVRLIEQERVTHLCGAPVVVSSLAQYCEANGIKFARGPRIVTGGAPPPPAVIRAAEEAGAKITHIYGLTETYGPHTLCKWKAEWDVLPPGERALMKARQGVPYLVAGTDVRVTDLHMNDVPADGARIARARQVRQYERARRINNGQRAVFEQRRRSLIQRW